VKSLKNVIEMGTFCGLAGFIIGSVFSFMSYGEGLFSFILFRATSASFITGSIVWYLLVVRQRNYSIGRVGLAGIIISIVSQFFLWYMQQFQNYLCFVTTGGCLNSFGEGPTFLSTIYVSFMALFLGLLWLGWLTIPLGFFIGIRVGNRQKENQVGSSL